MMALHPGMQDDSNIKRLHGGICQEKGIGPDMGVLRKFRENLALVGG